MFMRRRIYKAKRDAFVTRDVLLPIFIVTVLLAVFVFGVNTFQKSAEREQLSAIRNAITRASVQCYALEGQYPPNLRHITDNYGVYYDDSKFVVHYSVFASNIMPEIDVILVGSAEDLSETDFVVVE